MLTQAARSLEDVNPDAAADLLLEAIALLEQDARRGAGDAFKRAIALLIRNQRYYPSISGTGVVDLRIPTPRPRVFGLSSVSQDRTCDRGRGERDRLP